MNIDYQNVSVVLPYEHLKRLRSIGSFETLEGEVCKITGAVEVEEIDFLVKIIGDKVVNILDIGVGKGVSTALFSSLKNAQYVVGIDPCQHTEHKNSLYKLCSLLGLDVEKITLIQRRTIESQPSLERLGIKYDFVLVDGYHSFDATMIDFLVAHEFLRDGGLIAFHDCFYRQKQKVIQFILKNRDYEVVSSYPLCRRSLLVRVLRFMWHCKKYKLNPVRAVQFINPFRTDSSLVVLRRRSGFEPRYWEFGGL